MESKSKTTRTKTLRRRILAPIVTIAGIILLGAQTGPVSCFIPSSDCVVLYNGVESCGGFTGPGSASTECWFTNGVWVCDPSHWGGGGPVD